MKQKTKNTLRDNAKHVGLKYKFVSHFSDDVHGKLLPREKLILINAHKPRYEHTFTLLHEFGHYLLHCNSLPRKHHLRFTEIDWKIEWLTDICSIVRRYSRRLFAKDSSKEWEADLLAFLMFILLAKAAGCWNDLFAFLEHHPEKIWTFLLAALVITYGGIKTRIQKIPQTLLIPFRVLRKS